MQTLGSPLALYAVRTGKGPEREPGPGDTRVPLHTSASPSPALARRTEARVQPRPPVAEAAATTTGSLPNCGRLHTSRGDDRALPSASDACTRAFLMPRCRRAVREADFRQFQRRVSNPPTRPPPHLSFSPGRRWRGAPMPVCSLAHRRLKPQQRLQEASQTAGGFNLAEGMIRCGPQHPMHPGMHWRFFDAAMPASSPRSGLPAVPAAGFQPVGAPLPPHLSFSLSLRWHGAPMPVCSLAPFARLPVLVAVASAAHPAWIPRRGVDSRPPRRELVPPVTLA
jgi:hypothetical protein